MSYCSRTCNVSNNSCETSNDWDCRWICGWISAKQDILPLEQISPFKKMVAGYLDAISGAVIPYLHLAATKAASCPLDIYGSDTSVYNSLIMSFGSIPAFSRIPSLSLNISQSCSTSILARSIIVFMLFVVFLLVKCCALEACPNMLMVVLRWCNYGLSRKIWVVSQK